MRNLILIIIIFISAQILNAKDYYWVNGSGSWHSYFENWAFESGGNPIEQGQVPGPDDNVIFDENSFAGEDTVTIDVTTDAACRNFDFRQIESLDKFIIFHHQSSKSLRIYGSMYLATNMDFNITKSIEYNAESGNFELFSNGKALPLIFFYGSNAEWSIEGEMSTKNVYIMGKGSKVILNGRLNSESIYQYYGSFNTNSYPVDCQNYVAYDNAEYLELGSSKFKIYDNSFTIRNSNIEVDAGTSEIIFNQGNSTFYNNDKTFYNVTFKDTINNTAYLYERGTYNHVKFSCNGRIDNNNTFDSLTFSAGKIYNIIAGKEQTVYENLSSEGTCNDYIFITTNEESSAGIIKPDGEVNIEYTALESIHTSGGATFTANNSIDMGNNTGWNINPANPRTLYWVGGTGNWNDAEHWSLLSGGAGGNCPPSSVDDVIFDDNSFANGDTIHLTEMVIFCHDMDWRETKKQINMNVQNYLRIYGSLWFEENLQLTSNSYNNRILFYARNSYEEILSAGVALPLIFFYGSNAEWSIEGEMSTKNVYIMGKGSKVILNGRLNSESIYQYYGSFNTNSYPVDCQNYVAYDNAEYLELGSSKFKIYDNSFTIRNSNIEVDAGTSEIIFNQGNSTFYNNDKTFYNVTFKDTINNTAYLYERGTYNHVKFSCNGRIDNNNTFDSLTFSAGKIYNIIAGKEQTVYENLSSEGTCNDYIFITTNEESSAGIIKPDGEVNIEYTALESIHTSGGATFTANNSIDMGNNTGWNINPANPRTLYWVGGTGNWNDAEHWSLLSGGAGGNCPPSSVDDVIFDDNSFANGDTIHLTEMVIFCHDMDWRETKKQINMNVQNYLRIYGSLWFEENLQLTSNSYNNRILFYARNSYEEILSAGVALPLIFFYGSNAEWSIEGEMSTKNVYIMGKGSKVILNGRLNSESIYQYYGSFNTNSYPVDCQNYVAYDNAEYLELGSSKFKIYDNSFTIRNSNIEVDAGTSEIIFNQGNSTFYNNDKTFYNVTFKDTINNTAYLYERGTYNHVKFSCNGRIDNNNTFDSLTFSPGYTYNITGGAQQTINEYFSVRGNQCFPIVINAVDKDKPTFVKESGIVSGDFLELYNVRAEGGATFYAGTYSSNYQNSNPGWVFSNSPGYIYGLGNDTIMCKGENLETFNFNGAKEYLWHDGSTKPEYIVNKTEEVWVRVTYADDCVFYDTIYVEIIDNAVLDAGDDIYICEPYTEANVFVSIKEGVEPYDIIWTPSDGIDDPYSETITISNDTTTQYIVTVISRNNCEAKDTVNYYIIKDIKPKISRQGEYLVSNIKEGNQWYFNGEEIPGANNDRIIPYQKGEYTVQVTLNGCTSSVSELFFFYEDVDVDVVINVASLSAEPGNIVNIPITVLNYETLTDNDIYSFSGTFEYNPNILYSNDYHNIAVIEGNSAKIQVEFEYSSMEPEIWANLEFTAMLGNTNKSTLIISDLYFDEEEVSSAIVNGIFTLDGVCDDGNLRLFEDDADIYLSQIVPNPASETVNITFRVNGESHTELAIYNLLGKKIKVLEEGIMEAGEYSNTYNLFGLSSGIYYYVLKSGGGSISKKMAIVK